MNDSLRFVHPVMLLDATHLKLSFKGTMYLATMKTGLIEIHMVAFEIKRANECYEDWNSFLTYLECMRFVRNESSWTRLQTVRLFHLWFG
jgi:hypothetical protein